MRIRSIKPEFYSSQTLARLDRSARFTFVGLWAYVDDNGVGVDDPRLIAAALCPLDDDPVAAREEIAADLDALAAVGVIARYQIDGRQLLFVVSWDEHQKIGHPRKPRFPRPTSVSAADESVARDVEDTDSGSLQKTSETRMKIADVSREQGTGNREVKKETSSPSSRPAAPPVDVEHEQSLTDTKPDRPAVQTRPDVEELCSRLHELVTAHGCKATVTSGWRKAARLLLDRDGRDLDEALAVLDWCQRDEFWRSNVLSLPTFRKHYDRLRLKASAEPGWSAGRPVTELPDAQIDADAILGPDITSPPAPPREVEDGPAEARRAWFAQWRQRHHAERVEQARTVLARRAEQAGRVSA